MTAAASGRRSGSFPDAPPAGSSDCARFGNGRKNSEINGKSLHGGTPLITADAMLLLEALPGGQQGPDALRLRRKRRLPGRMPLAESRRQRPARHQMLNRKLPLDRLPRLEGLPRRGRLTKKFGTQPGCLGSNLEKFADPERPCQRLFDSIRI